ncbi:SulP family inorganic anion transporter [Methylocystis echinoides]|uniref:SulP family inorganic anion transporter n=1 Tax=Methylocystis echinoides TaxID=29468 RepID=UPI0034469BB0
MNRPVRPPPASSRLRPFAGFVRMTPNDLVSGLVAPVVIIATSLSYSALIFSGPLADYLPIGIGSGLIGAGLGAIVFAALSGLPFAVAAPDSKAIAVLASMAGLIANNLFRQGHADQAGPTALAAVVLGSAIVGVTSFLFGVLKLGRWIRFLPYPVIGGFMAASGWFLTSGAIRILAHEPLSLKLLSDVAAGRHVAQLACGVLFAAALAKAQRSRNPLAFPAFLVLGTMVLPLGLFLAGVPAGEARAAGWLLDLPASSSVSLPASWLATAIGQVEWREILRYSGDYVALITVVVATLLLSIMALEVESQAEVDLDYELKVNGAANMVAAVSGGAATTLSVSRTLFGFKTGARSRGGGALAGLLCLFPLALGPGPLGFVPVPILAGLLLQLGVSMLDEWLIRGWRAMQRADYVQLVAIFLTIAWFDFVAGVGVGVVAACITFAVNTSRIRLVKHGMDRSNFASRVDRPNYHAEALRRQGAGIQIMWLHGFIFFGSAHNLLMHIKEALRREEAACRSLILDFRQVLGIDYSAVMTLHKLRHFAEREGFDLVFADLPQNVARSLSKGGLIAAEGDAICHVFPNLDAALEWCEDRLLANSAAIEEGRRSTQEWLKAELGSDALFEQLKSYFAVLELQPGDFVFRQGESGESLFLLSSGRVTILFTAPDGQDVRLRSMVGHTMLGEMGLYRDMPRGASVLVDEPTVVYRFSQEAIARMEREEPALAHAFHRFVVRTLASRLDFANREVAGLQR